VKIIVSAVIILIIVGSVLLGVAISWLGASAVLSFLRRAGGGK
jgi:cell division protein FtsX